MEKDYKINKFFDNSEEYLYFIHECLTKQIERNERLNYIYSSILNLLISMKQFLHTPIVFQSQKLINKDNINILLLKNKIIKLNNRNQKEQFFIRKLLSILHHKIINKGISL